MMKPTLNRPESTGRSVRVDVRLDDIGLDVRVGADDGAVTTIVVAVDAAGGSRVGRLEVGGEDARCSECRDRPDHLACQGRGGVRRGPA